MSSSNTSEPNAQVIRALASLREMRKRLEDVDKARNEPIAIIGMGCRFPGADGPDAFWELLAGGVDAITETPADRWDAASIFDLDPEATGRVATRWGGFLEGLDQFDASFFGIAPREASQMDPQQRLLLEVAWETLENGGQSIEALAGTRTGVFVGIHSHSSDYYMMQVADQRRLDLYSGTGTSHSVVSGRLSYLLDLRGPSIAIDTACSSSLVAVHLAVQSLRNGESSLAIAAGVNVMIDPTFTMVASRMRMLSARGRCQPFDGRADGFVRSEGCGAVLLKRLSDAVADGDRVLAVINGSAVNQDGRSNGLTAPNSLSQQAVIHEAMTNAGVTIDQVGMIETHGTGTPLGDPIEIEALAAVFAGAGQRIALGSGKANIGHLEGAAGIAALIKAVLSLRNGHVPPLVHFETLNPHISLDGTPFVISNAIQSWPAHDGSDRHAGISSFGWSGTNAHVIIGSAPSQDTVVVSGQQESRHGGAHILPVSARSAAALETLVGAFGALLRDDPAIDVAELCASASLRRSHHDHRATFVSCDATDLADQLDAFHAVDAGPADRADAGLLVFVFPGHGGQWLGMGRQLLVGSPTFRSSIERTERAFSPYVDWSLVEQLTHDESRLDEIGVLQPVVFAIQLALAAVWESWGVRPDAVVGHSMGEVAAAYVAGILSLDDAARTICLRSRLLDRIRGHGSMAVVGLSVGDAGRAIAGREDVLSIAAVNGPTSTVLSGDPVALDEVTTGLARNDVFCRLVKVDVAAHSPQVEPLIDELVDGLAGLQPRAAVIPFSSTVTGNDEPVLDAWYWAQNLRQPVEFARSLAGLIASGHRRFVELSPHPVLLGSIGEAMQGGCAVASLRRDSDEHVAMLQGLAMLYDSGYPVDWRRVHGTSDPVPFVEMPTYPWQREHHWLPPSTPLVGRRGRREDPLLGWSVPIGDAGEIAIWENTLERSDLPGLYEHCIGGVPSLPASALVDIVSRAAVSSFGADVSVTDVRFERLLILDVDEPTTIQVVLNRGSTAAGQGALASIHISSRTDEAWTRHVTASVRAPLTTEVPDQLDRSVLDDVRHRADHELSGVDVSRQLQAAGVLLGPALRSIERTWSSDTRRVALIERPAEAKTVVSAFDACLQTASLVESLEPDGERSIFVPVAAQHITLHAPATSRMTCIVSFDPASTSEVRTAECALYDDQGSLVARIGGLELQRLDHAAARTDDSFYALEWRRREPMTPAEAAPQIAAPDGWLIFADRSGVGGELARQLRADGARCVLVTAGEVTQRVDEDTLVVHFGEPQAAESLRGAIDGCTSIGVIYLWGLDSPAGDEVTAASLEVAHRHAGDGLINVAQVFASAGIAFRIWIGTRGVWRVDQDRDIDRSSASSLAGGRVGSDAGSLVAVAQAGLWGLGLTLAEEAPESWGGLVDIDPSADDRSAAAGLIAEIAQAGPERLVARRDGHIFDARLARRAMPSHAPTNFRSDGTYLITGGFGALGKQVAEWMIERGARRLVLVGRTSLPDRRTWSELDPESPEGRRAATVIGLEGRGAAVHAVALDVADEQQLGSFLDDFRAAGWPRIRGVVHAAGAAGAGLIANLEPSAAWAQMRSKVAGGWLLHRMIEDLDHFVVFSSIASFMPQAGQGPYAAANAFLDALARHRVALGLPALSIDWGVWSGSGDGMLGASATRQLEQMVAQGVSSFRPAQGLDALDRLLASDMDQVAFVPVDWVRYSATRSAGDRALFEELLPHDDVPVDSPGVPSADSLSGQLERVPAEERLGVTEAVVRRAVAKVLRMSEGRIGAHQTFGALGLDSLMAIELRNRLEAEVGSKLSATLAWNYPTVVDLAAHLLSGFTARADAHRADDQPTHEPDADLGGGESAQSNEVGSMDRMVTAIDDLNDDDALAALMGRIDR